MLRCRQSIQMEDQCRSAYYHDVTLFSNGSVWPKKLWAASRINTPIQACCTISFNAFINNVLMNLRTSDVVPISEARARLTELAEEVVDGGAEKVLTKNGSSYVAIIDAKKLDYYHALEEEHAGLVLLDEAEIGLRQILDGKRVSATDLLQALADG